MIPPDQERTEESSEGSSGKWLGLERRPLLRAVGAGTAVSLGGGIAAASGDAADDGAGVGDDADSGRIDPVYGYTTRDVAAIPDSLGPDHEVELAVSPPSGPGQPPLLYFDPTGLHVDPGDIVQFTAVSPDHTVTAYHPGIGFEEGRVPPEAEPFSSPVIGPGAAWLYRFEHEGVYDVYCGPHHILGMVMRLVVGDLDESAVPEYAESVESVPGREELSAQLDMLSEENDGCEWPFLTPADVFGVDALDPMAIQETGEVPFETVALALGHELGGEAEAAAPTVQVGTHPEHGEILVGPDEMTLYMFEQDTSGERASACHDDCADAWPPLTVEDEPVAGDGVTADIGAFERETGETQVTANGWPLYYFARDEAPGDATGQGVNDVWWVLGPDGSPIRD